MGFSYSALKDTIAEFGRNILIQQANMKAPLVDLMQEDGKPRDKLKVFDVLKLPQEVGRIVVSSGGYGSTGWSADGGSRRIADDYDITTGTYGFKILDGAIKFPIGITKVARGGNGIDLFKQAVMSSGRDFGRTLDRGILSSALSAPVGTVLAGAATFPVADPNGYRPGMKVDFFSGSTLIESAEVLSIANAAPGSNSTITLTAAVTNALTGLTAFIQGAGVASRRLKSLSDVNTAGALYDGFATNDQPAGIQDSTTTTWSNTVAGQFIDRIAEISGEKPSHIICSSVGARRIYNAQNPQLRFSGGEELDVYGSKMKFDSLMIAIDDNQSRAVYDFVNSDSIKLHEFWPVGPVTDGDNKGSWNRDSMQLSQTQVAWELYVNGGYELRAERRNTNGQFTAITA